MIPFSKEHVASLRVGESFETDGVFPGVSKDKVIWKVTAATEGKKGSKFHLEARYLGVYFGSYAFYDGRLELTEQV